MASFIASDLDRSTLIFNRFDTLAARNLLFMQGELAELQSELEAIDVEDSVNGEAKMASRNWKEFKKKAASQPRRMELIKEIRDLMKEYRKLPVP